MTPGIESTTFIYFDVVSNDNARADHIVETPDVQKPSAFELLSRRHHETYCSSAEKHRRRRFPMRFLANYLLFTTVSSVVFATLSGAKGLFLTGKWSFSVTSGKRDRYHTHTVLNTRAISKHVFSNSIFAKKKPFAGWIEWVVFLFSDLVDGSPQAAAAAVTSFHVNPENVSNNETVHENVGFFVRSFLFQFIWNARYDIHDGLFYTVCVEIHLVHKYIL